MLVDFSQRKEKNIYIMKKTESYNVTGGTANDSWSGVPTAQRMSEEETLGAGPGGVQLSVLESGPNHNNNNNPTSDVPSLLEETTNYKIGQSVAFLFLASILVANLITDWRVTLALDVELANVKALVISDANATAALELYAAVTGIVKDDEYDYCDVPFFSTELGEAGRAQLTDALGDLAYASGIVFYVSLAPALFSMLYKLAIVYDLWFPGKTNKMAGSASAARAMDPVTNPGLPFRGFMKTGHTAEKRQFRKERTFLRTESFFLFFAQLTEDIPQAMIAILFLVFEQSRRGYRCMQCIADGELCKPRYLFDDGNFAASTSFVVIVVSVLASGALLAHKWAHYVERKRQAIDHEPSSAAKRAVLYLVVVVAYFASVFTPLGLLVYTYIGPEFYGSTTESSAPLLVATIAGAIAWAVGMISAMCVCGVEAGESIFTTCAICELGEEVCSMCVICDACGDGCCCCCC